jgi:small subunit ribosomal protein S7
MYNNNLFLTDNLIKKSRKLAQEKKRNKWRLKKKLRFKNKASRLKLRKIVKKKRFLFNKLVNLLNKKGKKTKAHRMVLNILITIRFLTGYSPFFIIYWFIKELKPYVKSIKVRKAGKVYEVPIPLTKKKQLFLVLTWLINSVKVKNNLNLVKSFISELLYGCFNDSKSKSLKYKNESDKKAYINRAIHHFRWY